MYFYTTNNTNNTSTSGFNTTKIDAILDKTYSIKIAGDFTMNVYNSNNRIISADKVSFNFIKQKTGIKLEVNTNMFDWYTFNSLIELKKYIQNVKITYKKAKEFEKQLNIIDDFT